MVYLSSLWLICYGFKWPVPSNPNLALIRTVSDQVSYPCSVLALVDVLGVFTSKIGFCTPKIRRSDVLWLPHKILYARRQYLWRIYWYWEFGHLISPPSSESQVCVMIKNSFSDWPMGAHDNLRPPTACCADLIDRCWIVIATTTSVIIGKPFQVFLVQNFVAFPPSKYYSNIC